MSLLFFDATSLSNTMVLQSQNVVLGEFSLHILRFDIRLDKASHVAQQKFSFSKRLLITACLISYNIFSCFNHASKCQKAHQIALLKIYCYLLANTSWQDMDKISDKIVKLSIRSDLLAEQLQNYLNWTQKKN